MAARVVLAMSGGVDSSVAAHLLRRQGYDVIGLFMRTGVHGDADGRADHKKGCCSAVDAGDARRVADRLDIPFYALDFEGEFNRIIDYFADEYLAGRTPNPCVVCNNWLKFGQLWTYGRQLDADFIATGHYARVQHTDTGVELHRAADPDKDQSYVLYGLRREVLPHLLFPIGGYRKDEVRTLAREAGLGVADKPDSVEICFVPGGDHAALIRHAGPSTPRRDTSSIRPARYWPSTTASSSSRSASARASASRPASGVTCCASCRGITRSSSGRVRNCWRRDWRRRA